MLISTKELIPCIIVEVPLSQLRVFSVCCVVSTVEGAAVVGDGVAVVGGAGQAVRVLGQAQPSQGEGDCGAELLSESFSRRKSLEVDH